MTRLVGTLLLAVLALAGCGSGSDDDDSSSAPPGSTAEEPPSADCREAPMSLARDIAAGDNDPPAIEPVAIAAYEAPDFDERTFFVAMEFDTPGAGGSVGIWATTALRGPNTIISVDGLANRFTVWPDAGEAFGITVADPEADEALACLEASR